MEDLKLYSSKSKKFLPATPKLILKHTCHKIWQVKEYNMNPGQLFFDNIPKCFQTLMTPQQKTLYLTYMLELANILKNASITALILQKVNTCRYSELHKPLINQLADVYKSQSSLQNLKAEPKYELQQSYSWTNTDTLMKLANYSV